MFGANTDYSVLNKSLIWIEPILVQWLRIQRDYIEAYDCNDSLYWYNERANVSAFAGAVWKCGGHALEEFSAIKGKGEAKSNGRVDLFFYYANHEVICEAKQNWIYLCKNQRKDFNALISSSVESAIKDVQHTLDSNKRKYALALNFFPTYSKKGNDVKTQMRAFSESIKTHKCSFFAWFENDSGKDIVSSKNNVCNAVALIGNLIS